jgi:hypothetical protein
MNVIDKKCIFPIWAVAVLSTWLYLILTGPGFALYDTHWLYAVMMVFGSAIAGFTPEGGGAVAFNQMLSDKEKSVTLACDSYHEAEIWVHAIEIQIRELE